MHVEKSKGDHLHLFAKTGLSGSGLKSKIEVQNENRTCLPGLVLEKIKFE